MGVTELDQVKQRARATWAAGNYDRVAEQIWDVGAKVVRRVGVSAGERVLDLACGTGNAAIPAAQAGADVIGLDLTPELFDAARARAAGAGVEVDWVEGDAEALPFDDGSFDVVLSTFGCLWVPRHEVCASEIARVLRPGGRLALTNWTPEGTFGAFAATMAEFMPPPPEFAGPPPMWGNEDYVRGLFSGTGVELEFARDFAHWRFDSMAEALDSLENDLGPAVKMREFLEPQGRWPELDARIRSWLEEANVSDDDTVLAPQEYLITLGRKS